MMKRSHLLAIILGLNVNYLVSPINANAQASNSSIMGYNQGGRALPQADAFIRSLFDSSLLSGQSWPLLTILCKEAGHRLTGSEGAAKAVLLTRKQMLRMGYDSVWLQPVQVPVWKRGAPERAKLLVSSAGQGRIKKEDQLDLAVLALGGSVATPMGGIRAEVLEVGSLDELKSIPDDRVKGKLVFINQKMDARYINTFESYSHCASIRVQGAVEAAQKGALAVLVRSLTLSIDSFPHTGMMVYRDSIPRIPAAAVSTLHAEYIHKQLLQGKKLEVELTLNCSNHPDTLSFNVVGQIKGSLYPERYITIGGHLDSWDVGEGAHDDGAGCVHSIEAARLLMACGYKPQHSIRTILYMNEENGMRGAREYARLARENQEVHLASIESDRGGFSPREFHVEADSQRIADLQPMLGALMDYGIHRIQKGGSGADVGQMRDQCALLMGFVPDSQRYFDYHHARTDVLESVNRRELELGSAALAALLYLLDRE
jgi:hypothetical protein